MKVKELIKELRKMPKECDLMFKSHDQIYEKSNEGDPVNGVCYIDKDENGDELVIIHS